MQHIYEKARKITMVIFDVDGVLTDGGIYLGATDGAPSASTVAMSPDAVTVPSGVVLEAKL